MGEKPMADATHEKEDVYQLIKSHLIELFDFEEDAISPSSHIVNDLDLDSIDAVDIIVKIQEHTGKKLDPERFKEIQTIADIVEEASRA
jgi:acyl carrier protein